MIKIGLTEIVFKDLVLLAEGKGCLRALLNMIMGLGLP
jgi:hypothetical protein